MAKAKALRDAKDESWEKKIDDLICQDHPNLVGVEIDYGLAEWVRKQDIHKARALLLQRRFGRGNRTVFRTSTATRYVEEALGDLEYKTTTGGDAQGVYWAIKILNWET